MFSSEKENVHAVKKDGRKLRDDAETTKRHLIDIAEDAGHKARHYIDTTYDEVSHAADSVAKQVRRNPVQSSLIALGVGYLLGNLFRR